MKTTRRTAALGLALLLFSSVRSPPRAGPRRKRARLRRSPPCAARRSEQRREGPQNQRRFLGFDVTIVSFERVPGDASADSSLPILQTGRVHIVHDMSCGGARIALAPGDAAEIRGEYVESPGGEGPHSLHAPGRRLVRAEGADTPDWRDPEEDRRRGSQEEPPEPGPAPVAPTTSPARALSAFCRVGRVRAGVRGDLRGRRPMRFSARDWHSGRAAAASSASSSTGRRSTPPS